MIEHVDDVSLSVCVPGRYVIAARPRLRPRSPLALFISPAINNALSANEIVSCRVCDVQTLKLYRRLIELG